MMLGETQGLGWAWLAPLITAAAGANASQDTSALQFQAQLDAADRRKRFAVAGGIAAAVAAVGAIYYFAVRKR